VVGCCLGGRGGAYSAMQRCPYCGSNDLVVDHKRGDTVCGNPACGELLEETNMVAETAWVSTSGGAKAMAGTEVKWAGFTNFNAGANHELMVAKGMTTLSYIADRLQLSTSIQEAGRRMYTLAVQMNFNQGRPSKFVASACLYVVCRRNRSPHLLIDFSDALESPVKKLGRVYMKLARRLVGADPSFPHAAGTGIVEVPIVDPSVFIERFARRLEFGGMQRKVQNTAMRLIQFMHRDWICTGRRPNGLCGAALLVAAYYHGFRCSAKDVSDVVRMGEATIRQRLYEMQETPIATMSRKQFEQDVDSDQALGQTEIVRAVPPCLKRSRRKEEMAALRDKDPDAIEDRERLALKDFVAMPPPLAAPTKCKRLSVVPEAKSLTDVEGSSSGSSGAAGTHGNMRGEGGTSANTGASGPQSVVEKYFVREPTSADITHIAQDIAKQHHIVDILGTTGQDTPGWGAAVEHIQNLEQGRPGFEDLPLAQRSAEAGGEAETALSEKGSTAGNEDETLSDVDDEELEIYLLGEEERQHKSDIWHEVNKDYLEEWHVRSQEARRKKKQQQQQQSGTSDGADSTSETGSASRSRRSRLPAASSCTQSAMMALSKKGKVSTNRINIEALESLFS